MKQEISTGSELAEQGMKTAIDHANAVHESWSDGAFKHLNNFINEIGGVFICEEVRAYAESKEHPKPPDNRAWGGILRKASKQGLIRSLGYIKRKDPICHAGVSTAWTKVIIEE